MGKMCGTMKKFVSSENTKEKETLQLLVLVKGIEFRAQLRHENTKVTNI